MPSQIISSYAYHTHLIPEFAAVDHKHIFIPCFRMEEAIGKVLRVHPCEPALSNEYVTWDVELFDLKQHPIAVVTVKSFCHLIIEKLF